MLLRVLKIKAQLKKLLTLHRVLNITAYDYYWERGVTPAYQAVETIGSIGIGHFDLTCRNFAVSCAVRHAHTWTSNQLLCHEFNSSFKIADKTVLTSHIYHCQQAGQ